jgi:molecular chaperone HscB
MNYFELFEIPVQLKVDTAELKQKFYSLSKKYHPDYAAGGSDEQQATALDMSAILNKAWKTFQDTDATIRYVLREKGLLEEEEKFELPHGFLGEVLEINEALMDSDPGNKPQLQTHIDNLQNEIYEPVKDIVENYTEDTVAEKELLQVKEYYFKKKYLDRIRGQLREMQ